MPDQNCPICGGDIAATGASAGDEAPIETALTLAEHLTRLLGQYLGDHVRPESATSGREPIRHIQRWIQERLREDLSVARLASEAGMSQRNFARAFVQEMRMTPAEYVRISRLRAAERLLEVTALPVQLIAFESGLSTQALRRACLLRHGLTPSEYRTKVKPRGNPDKP
jgi:transcriptional regulator GlxA family with amidase domain